MVDFSCSKFHLRSALKIIKYFFYFRRYFVLHWLCMMTKRDHIPVIVISVKLFWLWLQKPHPLAGKTFCLGVAANQMKDGLKSQKQVKWLVSGNLMELMQSYSIRKNCLCTVSNVHLISFSFSSLSKHIKSGTFNKC